jgi:SpoU rRNA methylase family enzyme
VQQRFNSLFNFLEIQMNQLVYSRKQVSAEPWGIAQLLKHAFKTSALGLFIAAVRNER